MAIRRRTHHGFGPKLPPARSVVDEELLAEALRQPLPYHTRDDVKLAAGGVPTTLPRLFQSMVPRPDASIVNTLRTSDCDMPNCRAISDGLMPALNAARTALTCPRVNETVAAPTCRLGRDLSVRDERFVV
jgi:hypothetical protein